LAEGKSYDSCHIIIVIVAVSKYGKVLHLIVQFFVDHDLRC
jgi:hypothetical protein